MHTIKLQQRGTLTLPKKIRDTLSLFEGQHLRVTQKGNTIILEPQDKHDARLFADIKQSLEDLKNGDYIEFSTIEEFHEKLKQYED